MHTIRIRWNKELLEHANNDAEFSYRKMVIRLNPARPHSVIFEGLIHELRHAGDSIFGFEAKADPERVVTGESAALTQALISLGIEPDFSEIREEE